jgi:hypothetical protein
MVNVIMLIVIMLSVIVLIVIMLIVIMLSVVAPILLIEYFFSLNTLKRSSLQKELVNLLRKSFMKMTLGANPLKMFRVNLIHFYCKLDHFSAKLENSVQ